jgi:L-iditol 2-dehydrogenase
MLTGLRQLELSHVPDPEEIGDTDVRVRISYTGLCGSDLHYFRTGRIGSQIVSYPFVIGHECTGTVLETGSRVSSVRPGDPVAVEPAVSCGTCDQCLEGRPHTCRTSQFLGCPGQLTGSMTEIIVTTESCCFKLPSGLSLKAAVFIEPLSVAIYSWRFLDGIKVKNIGILGAGPIGLCVLMAARRRKGVCSYVTDRTEARLGAANKLGAEWTAYPGQEDRVRDKGIEMDAVFECCGQQQAVEEAVRLLKPGGHLVLVGIPETDTLPFNLHKMRRREITIHNVHRQNGCFEEAVHLCSIRRREIEKLVTHSFEPDQAQEAFLLNESYRDNVVKSVIRFS